MEFIELSCVIFERHWYVLLVIADFEPRILMSRQESQVSSASTAVDLREAVPSFACAPEARRLLHRGSLAVSLLLLGGAFSFWWAARQIQPLPYGAANSVTPHKTTLRGQLISSTTQSSEWIFLRKINIVPSAPPLLTRWRKNNSNVLHKYLINLECPRENDYGSVCDYLECSPQVEAAKSILLWNTRWAFEPEWTGESGATGLAECRPKDCLVAVRPSAVPPEAFDAVVFDMGESLPHWHDRPENRSCFQRYVFLMLEYPKSQAPSTWDAWLFNWTMTYRLDSDVPLPVGRMVPKDGVRDPRRGWMPVGAPPVTLSEFSSGTYPDDVGANAKMGAAAVTWLTSCDLESSALRKRIYAYVQKLSWFMEVHVYAVHGDFWSKPDWERFFRVLSQKHYKFYLVFEMPRCNHFVASHLFRALQLNMVPVVFGSVDYSAVVPPYSYISVGEFGRHERLASYLNFLLRTPSEYAKFSWWKPLYEVKIDSRRTLCQLCAKLHGDNAFSSYGSVKKWFDHTF